MDKHKDRGQQSQDRREPQTPLQNPNRETPGQDDNRGNQSTKPPQIPPERGRGSKGERNSSSSSSGSSGISNRGMDREEEQEDVPDRGSERQSER
jgi:hypothetical protein